MNRSTMTSNRGAILIHVAIAIFALMAVTAFVVDYGVMWVGRGQAQNAADAGALAGAVSMAFDPNGWTTRGTPTDPARLAARQMALTNFVWGQPPDVLMATDVFFTGTPANMCPPDPAGLTPCIRVDVYRNQARNNALPAFFGLAVGVTQQGVRATATARVAVADASDCMRPWAIPDKWIENDPVPGPWTATSTFETMSCQGGNCTPLANPDVYTAPSASSTGTGFTVANDLGMQVTLKAGSPSSAIAPGVFYPVRLPLPNGVSNGAADYLANIVGCNGQAVGIGDTVDTENGAIIGPTRMGANALYNQDPSATWDPTTKSVTNSCAQAANPCAAQSPRIVPIPVFDTGDYYLGKMSGRTTLTIVNVLGFFIDRIQGNDVVGYLTSAPGLAIGNGTITPAASFLASIQLVR